MTCGTRVEMVTDLDRLLHKPDTRMRSWDIILGVPINIGNFCLLESVVFQRPVSPVFWFCNCFLMESIV